VALPHLYKWDYMRNSIIEELPTWSISIRIQKADQLGKVEVISKLKLRNFLTTEMPRSQE
jgi:hypothetical protein